MILNRWTIGVGSILAFILSLIVGVKRWEANIRSDVRAEIAAEQMAEDLAQAQADLEFQREQTAKSEAAVTALRADLSTMAGRVQASRVTIHERVVDGSLANGTIPPVKMATIDAIEALEREDRP